MRNKLPIVIGINLAIIFTGIIANAATCDDLKGTGFGKTHCTGVPRLQVVDDCLYACGENGIFCLSKEDNAAWEPFAMQGWNVVDFRRCGDEITAIIVPEEHKGQDMDMRPVCRLVKGSVDGTDFRDITPAEMEYQYRGMTLTYLSRLAQHPQSASTIAVIGHGGVFLSNNFGESWENISYYSLAYNGHSYLGWHPYKPDVMFLTSEDAAMTATIIRSDDGGRTWNPITPENDGDSCCHQLAFDPDNHDRMLAAGECCIWESTDCGKSWHYIYNNDPEFAYAFNVMFDPKDSNRCYAVECHPNYPHQGIYSSTDSGRSWAKMERFEFPGEKELEVVYYDAILFNGKIYIQGREDITFFDLGSSSGIDAINVTGSDTPAEYYNLQGIRLTNKPKNGIYVEKHGNTSKIVAL